MFDKLFEIVAKSTRFGFAVAFAGTVFLVGNKYGWWSVKLAPEQTSYIIFATLLGYGVLIAAVFANGFRIVWGFCEVLVLRLQQWWKNRNIMSRLDELTPNQLKAIYWISENPGAQVHGSIYDDPFKALCRKGFLIARSASSSDQGFKVNKVVFRKKRKIAEKLPANLRDAIAEGQAPWIRRII